MAGGRRWDLPAVQWLPAASPALGPALLRCVPPDASTCGGGCCALLAAVCLCRDVIDGRGTSTLSDTSTGGVNSRAEDILFSDLYQLQYDFINLSFDTIGLMKID
ncbi:hypothetical protein XELAEV_18002095mg [Xenopus laevis]|uniref:Uncharacterized protein n=1 Tax=Xenopus laevis TaxID=8355 RepID=A0A974BNZ3_XENLA|nr:hypothetical protein XELAEV_18002095mg [Xenopus laevis]